MIISLNLVTQFIFSSYSFSLVFSLVSYSQNRNFGRVQLQTHFQQSKIEKSHLAIFSRRSPHTDVIHQLLRAHFVDMPQALLPARALAVAASLQLELPQDTIVERTRVSLRQVQRIKHNLVIHGSIRKPKDVQQGRKSKITPDMEEVKTLLYSL